MGAWVRGWVGCWVVCVSMKPPNTHTHTHTHRPTHHTHTYTHTNARTDVSVAAKTMMMGSNVVGQSDPLFFGLAQDLDRTMEDLSQLNTALETGGHPPLEAVPYPFAGYENLPANKHPLITAKIQMVIEYGAGEMFLRGGGASGSSTRLAAERDIIETSVLQHARAASLDVIAD